jgi:hemerythrin-like metal-binding protein
MKNGTAWDDKYLLGIAAIDRQHRQLFDLIAELNVLVAAHAGTGEIQAVLQRFLRWAQTHFAAEETLLNITGYPSLAAHEQEHAEFLATLEKNLKLIAARPMAITQSDISALLTNWLLAHILKNDREYLPHLRNAIPSLP